MARTPQDEFVLVRPTKRSRSLNEVHRVSPMDDVMPRSYIQVVFVYQRLPPGGADALRASLAATLNQFPYLTGKMSLRADNGWQVTVSDEGFPWSVEESSMKITDMRSAQSASGEALYDYHTLPKSVFPDQSKFIVERARPNGGGTEKVWYCGGVKLTAFACGGFCLGVLLHHSISDADGFFHFMSTWSAIHRGAEYEKPVHDRKLLNARDDGDGGFAGVVREEDHSEYKFAKAWDLVSAAPTDVKNEKKEEKPEKKLIPDTPTLPPASLCTYRFPRARLERLKAYATAQVQHRLKPGAFLSTNDVLCALIWKHVIRARGLFDTQDEAARRDVNIMGQSCNGRARLKPALPVSYSGNCNFFALTRATVGDLDSASLGEVALMIRATVDGMTDSFMRGAIHLINQQPDKAQISPGWNSIWDKHWSFTSWAKQPAYAVTFDSSPESVPLHVSIGSILFDGMAILMNTPANDGSVDIILGLVTTHMQRLERDPVYQAFVSVSTSPTFVPLTDAQLQDHWAKLDSETPATSAQPTPSSSRSFSPAAIAASTPHQPGNQQLQPQQGRGWPRRLFTIGASVLVGAAALGLGYAVAGERPTTAQRSVTAAVGAACVAVGLWVSSRTTEPEELARKQ